MMKDFSPTYLMLTAILLGAHPYRVAQQSPTPGMQKRLSDFISGSKEEELLEPDQAFKFKVVASGPTTLTVDLVPANGYYLYKEKIRFALKNARGVVIKSVKLPAGKIKNDPTLERWRPMKSRSKQKSRLNAFRMQRT